jgi:CheY-like chemotaxis protein
VCLYFRPALTSVQTAPQTQDVPRGAGELILVVEDDPEVRAVTVARVEALGYRPVEAADAAGALAMLGEAQEIAALLSDVVMPGGLDGHALAREARRLRPGLPIILVSGYSKEMALGNGADGASFLSKPFSTAALAGALARVLKRRD